MPPRKRAETKPTDPTGPEQEPVEPEQESPALDERPPVADPDGVDPAKDDEAATKPAKSEIQQAEQPCAQCFPNGWLDGVFAVGCDHGTWQRT